MWIFYYVNRVITTFIWWKLFYNILMYTWSKLKITKKKFSKSSRMIFHHSTFDYIQQPVCTITITIKIYRFCFSVISHNEKILWFNEPGGKKVDKHPLENNWKTFFCRTLAVHQALSSSTLRVQVMKFFAKSF
jgi:hypothetical protein